LYGGNMDEKGNILKTPDVVKLKTDMFAVSITDGKTKETIKPVYDKYNVLLEPHGAVGWAGLQEYYKSKGGEAQNIPAVTLETAHPAKFPGEVNDILGIDPALPASLSNLDNKEEKVVHLDSSYASFKSFLVNNF